MFWFPQLTSSHPALKNYKMVKIESCFCSWATFHYFEIVCLVCYNQEHKPYWKKSDYFNKGFKECQPVRQPIKKVIDKGKAFFCKHVLAPIPQVKIKRDGVQCVAGTEQLTREFPSLHSSKGNWEVETRKRVPCASNSSINNILLQIFWAWGIPWALCSTHNPRSQEYSNNSKHSFPEVNAMTTARKSREQGNGQHYIFYLEAQSVGITA